MKRSVHAAQWRGVFDAFPGGVALGKVTRCLDRVVVWHRTAWDRLD